MFALLGSLISGALGIIGGVASAAGGLAAGVGSSAIGLGGAALSTAGAGGGGALDIAGKTVGGGLSILGGIPKATTETIDYLGKMQPQIIKGIQTYKSMYPDSPVITQPEKPFFSGEQQVAPPWAKTAPAPTIPSFGPVWYPTMPTAPAPEKAGPAPVVMTTPAAASAMPDYLIYVIIAIAAIVLLRK